MNHSNYLTSSYFVMNCRVFSVTDNPRSPFELTHFSHARRAIALTQNARMGQSVYPVPERLTAFVFDAAAANTALIGLARFGEPFAPSPPSRVCASASLCLRVPPRLSFPRPLLRPSSAPNRQAGRRAAGRHRLALHVSTTLAVCGGGDGQRQHARMKIGKRAATARAYVRE